MSEVRHQVRTYGGIVFFLLYQAHKYVLMLWYCNSEAPESTPCPTLTTHPASLKASESTPSWYWIHTKLLYMCVGDSVHRECS
jgi:hypothetical protein